MNEALLLKPADAAKALAISARKLWSLTAGRDIPCVRIGKAVRYDPADLRAWIDGQKIPSRELATGSEDSTMAFGKRELHPRPLAKRIKVSRKLLSRMPGVENFVNQRLAYKFGVSLEKAYMTGRWLEWPAWAVHRVERRH